MDDDKNPAGDFLDSDMERGGASLPNPASGNGKKRELTPEDKRILDEFKKWMERKRELTAGAIQNRFLVAATLPVRPTRPVPFAQFDNLSDISFSILLRKTDDVIGRILYRGKITPPEGFNREAEKKQKTAVGKALAHTSGGNTKAKKVGRSADIQAWLSEKSSELNEIFACIAKGIAYNDQIQPTLPIITFEDFTDGSVEIYRSKVGEYINALTDHSKDRGNRAGISRLKDARNDMIQDVLPRIEKVSGRSPESVKDRLQSELESFEREFIRQLIAKKKTTVFR